MGNLMDNVVLVNQRQDLEGPRISSNLLGPGLKAKLSSEGTSSADEAD